MAVFLTIIKRLLVILRPNSEGYQAIQRPLSILNKLVTAYSKRDNTVHPRLAHCKAVVFVIQHPPRTKQPYQ